MAYMPFFGSLSSRSKVANAGRRLNFFPELDETGKSIVALYGTPGLLQKTTCGTGPIRGEWVMAGVLYVVSGATLYQVDALWNATSLGTLSTSTGRVGMADNGTQLLIVDGVTGYTYDRSTAVFGEITDGDFPKGARTCAFQDGYFAMDVPSTGRFTITALYDGTSVDALDFATAEGSPDNTVGVLADHRELWIFGEKSTEVYWNSGNADFPFERIQGAFIENGCIAPHAAAKMDNSVFWIGRDDKGQAVVWRAAGYNPQRISNHKVEYALQGYGDISDAFAYCYQDEGHSFYLITFPSADRTWAFDASTNEWHERSYYASGVHKRHRSNAYAFFNGTHVVGDYQNGKIYALDMDTYTDNGDTIMGIVADRHQNSEMRRIRHKSLQIDFETGVGVYTGQGSDPQAMLRWSDDGGRTWGNTHSCTIGAIGNYRTRVKFNRLGVARDRVYELSVSDPIKRVIVGANLEAESLIA